MSMMRFESEHPPAFQHLHVPADFNFLQGSMGPVCELRMACKDMAYMFPELEARRKKKTYTKPKKIKHKRKKAHDSAAGPFNTEEIG